VEVDDGRELFSWTRGLRRGGGTKRQLNEIGGRSGVQLEGRGGRIEQVDGRAGRNSQNNDNPPGLATKQDSENTVGRTGYGYTRGSQEYVGRSRSKSRGRVSELDRRIQVQGKKILLESRGRPVQNVRETASPSLSLASALSLLEKSSRELTWSGQNRKERKQKEVETTSQSTRPSLRQSRRGRKVSTIPVVAPLITTIEEEKVGGSNAPGPTGYGYTRGSKEFVESRGRQSSVVRGRKGGSERAELRQGVRGREVAPIPPVYVNDEYEDYEEVYQDYGEEYQDYREEYEEDQDRYPVETDRYPEVKDRYPVVGDEEESDEGEFEGNGREQDAYGSQGSVNDRGRQEGEDDESQTTGDENTGGEVDDGQCGPECRNLLHELEHPKEHERCSNAGMVIDIWGYCRYIFHEERRDWAWWENLRTFVHGNGNSWYNSYRPTAYEEQG